MNINKNIDAYKTIGEAAKELGLVDKKSGKIQTHTLRYWETQFKEIKPSIKAGNRRYYSKDNFAILKKIKFLLKDKGLTIKGVKKVLTSKQIDNLDDDIDLGVYRSDLNTAKSIKNRIKKISHIIKDLKKYK